MRFHIQAQPPRLANICYQIEIYVFRLSNAPAVGVNINYVYGIHFNINSCFMDFLTIEPSLI